VLYQKRVNKKEMSCGRKGLEMSSRFAHGPCMRTEKGGENMRSSSREVISHISDEGTSSSILLIPSLLGATS